MISGSWRAAGGRYLPAFWHVLVVASHSPPALSQSAFDLTCERSVDLPPLVDGLADGDVVDGVLDEPGLALSANMSETATPRKFSVEGEQGLEDDERTGTSPRWTGDRGDGEGDPTAVYGGVQTEDRPGGRRV